MQRSSLAVTGIALLAASTFLAPRNAYAWCRTTTNFDFRETPTKPCDDIGKPLFWQTKCVGFSVQRDASAQINLQTARGIAAQAFSEWANVDCPVDPVACAAGVVGRHPTIAGLDLGPVACNQVEYNEVSGNANIIMFRDTNWPYAEANATLALTTVHFNKDTGEIYRSDIEVNSSDPTGTPITTGDTNVFYDLYSMLTHETGHVFGLAHTTVSRATMYSRYEARETFMRHPSLDDACGICAAYPPQRQAVCNPTPRNGLSSECHGGDHLAAKGCHCTVVGGLAEGGSAFAEWGAMAVALGLARRRLRASRR